MDCRDKMRNLHFTNALMIHALEQSKTFLFLLFRATVSVIEQKWARQTSWSVGPKDTLAEPSVCFISLGKYWRSLQTLIAQFSFTARPSHTDLPANTGASEHNKGTGALIIIYTLSNISKIEFPDLCPDGPMRPKVFTSLAWLTSSSLQFHPISKWEKIDFKFHWTQFKGLCRGWKV